MNFVLAIATFIPLVLGSSSQPFTIQVSPSTVKVIPAGGWHINQEYPWKIVMSDKSVGSFVLKWNGAEATKLKRGHGIVKGGMCNANTCVSFSRDVEIP